MLRNKLNTYIIKVLSYINKMCLWNTYAPEKAIFWEMIFDLDLWRWPWPSYQQICIIEMCFPQKHPSQKLRMLQVAEKTVWKQHCYQAL